MSDSYYRELRTEMLPFVPLECKRILEVGCSSGNFGMQLKKRQGAEVWGIEPNPEAAINAEKVLDRVINGYFTLDIDLPRNYFDCIIFNDVLEHMSDPWQSLDFSKELLVKGDVSYMIASIPNFRYIKNIYKLLVNKDFKYEDSGTLDKTHLRFFTLKSIRRMFDESGYEIINIAGINPSLHVSFRILNAISFNSLSDMKYYQYAVVARVRN